VNTDNGVCHCCAASACIELRNVNAPGMSTLRHCHQPCGAGRSEEAVVLDSHEALPGQQR
jgi:hypothetical protein